MIRISDQEVQGALDFLYDSAPEIGQAAADVTKAHAMLRHVKAMAMKASGQTAISAQERDAYASPEYEEAIQAEFEATQRFQVLKAKREAATAKLDCWRSASANQRAARI